MWIQNLTHQIFIFLHKMLPKILKSEKFDIFDIFGRFEELLANKLYLSLLKKSTGYRVVVGCFNPRISSKTLQKYS